MLGIRRSQVRIVGCTIAKIVGSCSSAEVLHVIVDVVRAFHIEYCHSVAQLTACFQHKLMKCSEFVCFQVHGCVRSKNHRYGIFLVQFFYTLLVFFNVFIFFAVVVADRNYETGAPAIVVE